jgi:hypothetical protein
MPHVGKTQDDRVKGPPRTGAGKTDSTQTKPLVDEKQIDGSMHTEEPLGWDQAPKDIKDPLHKRHPRPDGKGGIVPADDPEDGIMEKSG